MGLINKFIETLENGIYSTVDVEIPFSDMTPANLINNEILNKHYVPVSLESKYTYDSKLVHREAIFEYKNYEFFIFLKLKNNLKEDGLYDITIIYKTVNYEELKIYINNLKKQNQNGN